MDETDKNLVDDLTSLSELLEQEDQFEDYKTAGLTDEEIKEIEEFQERYCETDEEKDLITTLNRIIPIKKVNDLLKKLLLSSLSCYYILKQYETLPGFEQEEVNLWKNQMEAILNDKNSSLSTQISEFSFKQVQDLERIYIYGSTEKRYNPIKVQSETILKRAFTDLFYDFDKIIEFIKKTQKYTAQLKSRHGDFVDQFVDKVPPDFYVPIFQELTFASNYNIPKDTDVQDWIKEIIQYPEKASSMMDEIIFMLESSGKVIDNRQAVKEAIRIILKAQIKKISKILEASLNLDISEEITNEIRGADEQSPGIVESIKAKIKSAERELCKYFYNNFYEKKDDSKNIENHLLIYLFKNIPKLKELYVSKDKVARKRVIELLRYHLRIRSRKGTVGFDIKAMQKFVSSLDIVYGKTIDQLLKKAEKGAPEKIRNYIVEEEYLDDFNSIETEEKEVNLATISLKELSDNPIIIKKNLIFTKFAAYLAENDKNTLELFRLYVENENSNEKEHLLEFIKENYEEKGNYVYMLKETWNFVPDKIKIAFTIRELGYEALYIALTLLVEKFEFIQNIIKPLMQKQQFQTVVANDKISAAKLVVKLVSGNKLDKKIVLNVHNSEIEYDLISMIFEYGF